MAEYGYTVLYGQLTEGGYQVIVPALPGIVTYGRTLPEAREMASDAIDRRIEGIEGGIEGDRPNCPLRGPQAQGGSSGLAEGGLLCSRQSGSHVQLKHPTKTGRVTVPNHQGFDLPGSKGSKGDRRGQTELSPSRAPCHIRGLLKDNEEVPVDSVA